MTVAESGSVVVESPEPGGTYCAVTLFVRPSVMLAVEQ